jgi:NifU-like protein involved in Fe-S cluster formation
MTLYNKEILKLATAIAKFHRLPDAQVSIEKRSPVCGSRVTVDVRVDERGYIDAIGLEVRACALGQASAALMAANAHGRSVDELESARDALAAFLADNRSDPGGWPGLDIFAPAIPHRARHASIMLAFDAVAEAAREAAH